MNREVWIKNTSLSFPWFWIMGMQREEWNEKKRKEQQLKHHSTSVKVHREENDKQYLGTEKKAKWLPVSQAIFQSAE